MVTAARTNSTHPPLRRARGSDDGGESPFIWREALWGLDWLSLRLSPVYLGIGVPHGDGSPVILVPGFLTTDAYMVEMYFWLRRVGYSPFLSGIGVNADCIQTLTDRLEKTAEAAYAETGMPVRLIGHSLGGLLVRRLSLRRPDIVSQLISMGSPIQALEAHPAIMAAARFVGERAEHRREKSGSPGACLNNCECLDPSEVGRCPPPSVHHAAVYSRDDGVIDWRNSMEPEAALNHEVGGTHIGLVFNARAYRAVAELLAQAGDESRRRAA